MQPSLAHEPKATRIFDFCRSRWAICSFSSLRMAPLNRVSKIGHPPSPPHLYIWRPSPRARRPHRNWHRHPEFSHGCSRRRSRSHRRRQPSTWQIWVFRCAVMLAPPARPLSSGLFCSPAVWAGWPIQRAKGTISSTNLVISSARMAPSAALAQTSLTPLRLDAHLCQNPSQQGSAAALCSFAQCNGIHLGGSR